MAGVRFDHHQRQGAGAGRGMTLTPHGQLSLVSGDAEVRQALMMLLSTRPGERVMRPDYGCPLDRLAFAPLDATTEGLAIHYVRTAIERWEPRATLEMVDAVRGDDPGTLVVTVTYTVRATARADTVVFALDIAGGAL
jgi:phage baseplate assembly protein W